MKAVRENGVTLFFLGLTVVALAGQACAGLLVERAELTAHDEPPVSLWSYLTSSSFGVNVMENWQSEFLQFATFIAATIWLVQRGSAEAKGPEDAGRSAAPGSWVRRHGLLLVMCACFAITWSGQSVTGWRQFNQEQLMHQETTVSWLGYLGEADFWERTMQNWQSEFLAVAAMSIFTVYLREQGSPESKQLSTPDSANEPTY
ncbi:MAG: hypothetical protein JWM90_2966 [Thermoleophilia bacterium]|nr:hypothetical protein [Thermoleophilia bacterium]